MEYRRLGKSGLEVSTVCLGTMMFGDRTGDAEAGEIVAHAFDAGVNFIDTADVYAEWRVGDDHRRRDPRQSRALDTRDQGRQRDERRGQREAARPADCRAAGCSRPAMRASRASRTDWIDIYYLHRDDPKTPLAETIAAIGDLMRAGKIRYFGLSNYRGWRIAEIVRLCERRPCTPPVVCQPYYNLLNRMPEVEILPACDHYGIGVASYSPIARGVLTRKVRERRGACRFARGGARTRG